MVKHGEVGEGKDREGQKPPWPRCAGRYVLVLAVEHPARVRVRSGRTFDVRRGVYAYVGSAAGPGGLAARVRSYFQPRRRPHWHIDFLLAVARPLWALCFADSVGECHLAGVLSRLAGGDAVAGFGCSDCRCRSHLFRLGGPVEPEALAAQIAALDAGVAAARLGEPRSA